MQILRIILLVYLGLAALLFFTQRSLIFRAERRSSAELAALAAERRFLPWTNSVGTRIGWWRPFPGKTTGSVLIAHGNAGTAVGREYLADPIQGAAALDVFILEYPGYGDRAGEPGEASFLAAATEGFQLLVSRPGSLFLVGESLGSGVASFLAGQFPDRIAGICLLVPFNHLSAVAAAHYPWLPVGWLLRDRFPSDERLAQFHGRLAVVVAGADSIIPARLGRKLYEGYNGPKRLWEFPQQDHWNAIVQPVEVWIQLLNFLRGLEPESAAKP